MSYLFRVAHSEHLFDFSAEEKIERPTKHHPQLGCKARKLREIDGSPKPPDDETGKVDSKYSGHTGPTADRRELNKLASIFYDRSRATIVVVGPRAKLEGPLAEAGFTSIDLRDAEGNPVAAAPAPKVKVEAPATAEKKK